IIQANLHWQVDDIHACFELPNASSINHVCAFPLGIPFHPSYACVSQFHSQIVTPRPLSNEKPSTIPCLRGTFTTSNLSSSHFPTPGQQPILFQDVASILGLAIEPLIH
ncbi:hypothetical protein F5887DRAFT_887495, partial [Amanita rubescens]